MPLALAVLLAVTAIQGVAWAVIMPPFQGPDEIGHFAYTQKMVEARTLPWTPSGGHVAGPSISTELSSALQWGGVERLRGDPAARPPGSEVAVDLWRAEDARLTHADRADGGFTSAMSNPPLYYAYAAIPYAATSSASIFTRAMVLRLWTVPLLLVVVWASWFVAGELLGGRRPLQILATTAVALQPQLLQEGSIASPDVLLAAIWTGFLWLVIVILRRGATRARLAGLLALVVLSALTHARGVSIVAPALATLGILAWRRHRDRLTTAHRALLGATAVVAAVAGGVLVLDYATAGRFTAQHVRQFTSYLWQFYLPRLPFMDVPLGPQWRMRDVFIDRYFSGFAQLELSFSRGLLDVIAWASVALIALAVVGLFVRRGVVRRAWAVILVVAVSAIAYLLQLHVAGFRNLITGGGDPVLTGRYLLPFVSLYGVVVALAVGWLPRRLAAAAAGVVTGLLVLISLGSLGILVERFYA